MVDRLPVGRIAFVRVAGQMLPVALVLNRALPVRVATRQPWLHLLRGLTQLGAGALVFLSLTRIGLAEATALADIDPILITLGDALVLGERLGPRRIAGIAVACAAALIIPRPGTGAILPAALLPPAAACCHAANALAARAIGPRETAWAAMFWGRWSAPC